MLRSYRRPTLLLEFDENRQFGLCTKAELATDLSPTSTLSKLCLLLLHFPRLRLLWSRQPLHTIAIFDALKRGAAQPDLERAAAVGTHAEQVIWGGVGRRGEHHAKQEGDWKPAGSCKRYKIGHGVQSSQPHTSTLCNRPVLSSTERNGDDTAPTAPSIRPSQRLSPRRKRVRSST
jgi:hypothetical protein